MFRTAQSLQKQANKGAHAETKESKARPHVNIADLIKLKVRMSTTAGGLVKDDTQLVSSKKVEKERGVCEWQPTRVNLDRKPSKTRRRPYARRNLTLVSVLKLIVKLWFPLKKPKKKTSKANSQIINYINQNSYCCHLFFTIIINSSSFECRLRKQINLRKSPTKAELKLVLPDLP